MSIEGVLKGISMNKSIQVQNLHREKPISIKEGYLFSGILKIYPSVTNAKLLGIEDKGDEPYQLPEKKYRGFPGLIFLADYLNKECYRIVW